MSDERVGVVGGADSPGGSRRQAGPRAGRGLRDAFRLERPLPATPASRRLRRLIGVTALVVVVVESANLLVTDEPDAALYVRTMWALLRVIGFLFLMRAVRWGRAAARPFGLVLAVTTVFAVARLAAPRSGSLVPPVLVLVGFVVLAVLCGLIVWMLYRSPAIQEHLATRPVRRHIPGWVLTARIAVLAYAALLLVPFLVAVGTAFGERRQPVPVTIGLLAVWFGLFLVVAFVTPFASFLVVMGKRWARWLVGLVSVVVLVTQPLLCFALLGLDGLVRDGVPMVIIAVVGLYALHRSRGQPTWIRPTVGTPPVAGGSAEPA